MSPTKPAALKSKPPDLNLQIDSEVTRLIRQHARAHMKTEVCGVLIGEERNGIIEVQASIQANNAAQAGTHVTFTQDAWEEIYRVKDVSYPDHRIVGWYHSHPGFGVFLSEHDTFIHRNFFSAPNQVAWVYDPHTDEEGCFGWIDGDIHRIPSIAVLDLNGDGIERTPKEHTHLDLDDEADAYESAQRSAERSASNRSGPPAWLRILVTAFSYLSVAAIAFFIAFWFFPRVIGIAVDPRTNQPILIDGMPITTGNIDLEQLLRPRTPNPAAVPAPQPQPATAPQPNPTTGGSK